MHQVIYSRLAREDLYSLPQQISKRILKKIYFYSLQGNPLKFAKHLKESRLGEYRFRIGDYRAIFNVDAKGNIMILMILRIKHRKDIYDL